MNIAVIRGSLSRDPQERELPSGDRVVNYEVTVRDRAPADSVPVVWVDPGPGWDALVAGDEVVVTGRVRRRFFRVGTRTESRTEVLADKVVPARQAKRARALVDRAVVALEKRSW